MRFLIAFLLLAGTAFGAEPKTSYVVRVSVLDRSGGGSMHSVGSGCVVEADEALGLVLTNNHVTRERLNNSAITVQFDRGQRRTGLLVAQDAQNDLAAIIISQPPCRGCGLADRNSMIGDRVHTWGFGGRYTMARQTGIVSRFNGPGEWAEIQGAQAISGDSGGPALDSQGKLVGIVWGAGDGETEVVRTACLRRFLVAIPAQYRPCPGGVCPPPQAYVAAPLVPVRPLLRPPVVLVPVNPPVAPPQAVDPQNEPPPAPVPVAPTEAVKGCTCDQASIMALIAKLEERNQAIEVLIKGIAQRPPATGQPGVAGPKGDPGPAGPAGVAGKDGVVNVQAVADEVEKRIKGSLRVVMEPLP